MAADGDHNPDQPAVLSVIVERAWRKRWWILIIVAVCTILSATAAFVMHPVYRASTVLIPASGDRNSLSGALASGLGALGGLASLAGVNVGGRDAATEEALAVLHSRQFTESFIRDKDLLPVLFYRKWDPAAGDWKVPVKKRPTLAKAYKLFDENIRSIVRDKKTGLITVQVEWRDRADAATWANELVQRLNREMRSRAIAKADASVEFLNHEFEITQQVATREAIGRVIEAQVKQRMLADVTQEYAFRVVDDAIAPDEDDVVRPKKAMLIATGFLLGVLLSAFVVAIASPRRNYRGIAGVA